MPLNSPAEHIPGFEYRATQGEPLAMLHGIKEKIASIYPDQQTADDIRDLEGWRKLERIGIVVFRSTTLCVALSSRSR
jgi:hypothetical protein